jgi:hypothetical protein
VDDNQSKMPLTRQVRYYKQSRDHWRENAAKKQRKMREYLQLNRALTRSRDQWKEKAKQAKEHAEQAEEKVRELEKELGKKRGEELSQIVLDEEKQVSCHHYKVTTIKVSIEQIIEGGNSYRGVARTLKILSQSICLETPHYSSIRNWVYRLGLSELKRPKEKRDDWLYLIDLTVELGREQALVIYGVSEKSWREEILPKGRALQQTDGEIISLEITDSATGEWIKTILEKVSLEVGVPLQIVGDQGSNLRKGIKLYQQKYPQVISTYDVTHGMANLLKQELFGDEIFQNFLSDCHRCRQQLQQTELAFAAPPAQRAQCRYFNLERLVNWAHHILNSPITIFFELLAEEKIEKVEERLREKFRWLWSYEAEILFWMTRLNMTRSLEKQVKIEGFNIDSLGRFLNSLSSLDIPPSLDHFQGKILNYLEEQISPIQPHQTLLASSDILESLFGRYKQFSRRCPLKDFRSMLLTIPLATMNLTAELVKQGLQAITGKELSEWINEVFGQSMLSQRQTLFASSDMKTV